MLVSEYEDEKYENRDAYSHTYRVPLNPSSNGGETVSVKVHVFENSDGAEYYRGEILAQCYGAHTTTTDFELDMDSLNSLTDKVGS